MNRLLNLLPITECLAFAFVMGVLLRGFPGWGVGFTLPLLAVLLLAFTCRDQVALPGKSLGLALGALLTFMVLRDALAGFGRVTATAESFFRGVVYFWGWCLVATALTREAQWRVMRAALVAGTMAMLGYIGIDQVLQAVQDPLAVASVGFKTAANRNKLGVNLGFLAVWAGICLIFATQWSDRLLGLLLSGLMAFLLLANGGRGAVMGVAFGLAIVAARWRPRWLVLGVLVLVPLAAWLYARSPEWFIHGSLMNNRDVIMQATWPHLQNQIWFGGGSLYFIKIISPLVSDLPFIHNIYLEWQLAYGVAGWLLLASLAWQASARLDARAHDFAPWLVASWMFCLGYGLVDMTPANPPFVPAWLGLPFMVRQLLSRAR